MFSNDISLQYDLAPLCLSVFLKPLSLPTYVDPYQALSFHPALSSSLLFAPTRSPSRHTCPIYHGTPRHLVHPRSIPLGAIPPRFLLRTRADWDNERSFSRWSIDLGEMLSRDRSNHWHLSALSRERGRESPRARESLENIVLPADRPSVGCRSPLITVIGF